MIGSKNRKLFLGYNYIPYSTSLSHIWRFHRMSLFGFPQNGQLWNPKFSQPWIEGKREDVLVLRGWVLLLETRQMPIYVLLHFSIASAFHMPTPTELCYGCCNRELESPYPNVSQEWNYHTGATSQWNISCDYARNSKRSQDFYWSFHVFIR